jgi:hypothetical protein
MAQKYEFGRFRSPPSSTASVVKWDERQALVELRLRQIEFRRELVVFTYEYLEITRSAMPVRYLREAVGIFCRCRQSLLLFAEFMAPLVRREGGIHDRLLIGEQHFVFLRFGNPFSRARGSRRKYGLG